MPGIIGITKEKNNCKTIAKQLQNARNAMKYHGWYVDDSIFEDEFICASRTHLNVLGEKQSPAQKDNIFCWIEGEIYNIAEVSKQNKLNSENSADLLLDAYNCDLLDSICAHIDGYFVAVIYDQNNNSIHLISDRYGLKPLYIWNDNENFAWGSELKAFLSFSSFSPEIRKDAFDCFMDLGHMMGDITWFKNIEMLSASTIISYNLKNKKISERKYWTWEAIKQQDISFKDASEKLGQLLKRAINRRVNVKEKVGISLSGGLDSRAIIASVKNTRHITALTFGKAECQDVAIAKQVTKLTDCSHQIFNLDTGNWLDGRFNGVWKVDGMLNLLHMHASYIHEEIKKYCDININGFLGDALEGGSYLNGKALDKRIDDKISKKNYGIHNDLDAFTNIFYNCNHIEPYLLNNRGRRFIHSGIVEAAKTIEQRLPFMDNKLIEFMYSLPDKYRFKSKLYNSALLEAFPALYKTIPWQKTGIAIGEKLSVIRKIKKQLTNLIDKTRFANTLKNFSDYSNWLREPEIVELFSKILNPRQALYAQYTNIDFNKKYLRPHVNRKKDFSEQICRAVTVEIWLQQVYNKKFLNDDKKPL